MPQSAPYDQFNPEPDLPGPDAAADGAAEPQVRTRLVVVQGGSDAPHDTREGIQFIAHLLLPLVVLTAAIIASDAVLDQLRAANTAFEHHGVSLDDYRAGFRIGVVLLALLTVGGIWLRSKVALVASTALLTLFVATLTMGMALTSGLDDDQSHEFVPVRPMTAPQPADQTGATKGKPGDAHETADAGKGKAGSSNARSDAEDGDLERIAPPTGAAGPSGA